MIYTPLDIPQRPHWKAFAQHYEVGDQMIITGSYAESQVFVRAMRTCNIFCKVQKINDKQRMVTRIR